MFYGFLVFSSGLFNWCYSLRLGCGLITQRASLRLSVLSGEPRGVAVREDPKEPGAGTWKASAGFAPPPAARRTPAGPGTPEPRANLRRPGNGPRYSSRPRGAASICKGLTGSGPGAFSHSGVPPPRDPLILRGGMLTHCPLTQPVPACPTEPSSSAPSRGGLLPLPRCAPPSRRLLPLRTRGWGGGGPSPRGTSSSAGAAACRRRGPRRAPTLLPQPQDQRGQAACAQRAEAPREAPRAGGRGRTPGGSSRPLSPLQAPVGRAARPGTPPTAPGSAAGPPRGLWVALVISLVRGETTGNGRGSQAERSRPVSAVPTAERVARVARAAVPLSRLARVGVSSRNRRPAPGRGRTRRPGRPPAFRAFPEVGPCPRSSPENPGRSGNCPHPAASRLFYWLWSPGGKLLCIFVLKMSLEQPISSIKTLTVRSARPPRNSKSCTVTKAPSGRASARARHCRSGGEVRARGDTLLPGLPALLPRSRPTAPGGRGQVHPLGNPRGRGLRLGGAAEAKMGSDSRGWSGRG